jgi:predicted nucleotidyltransferase
MKTVGIIVEYNPLHYGHVYHFQESKKSANADAVVAVMSGNFLQRGEPAITNKWSRTEMALHMGADLVIELPVAFSSQPAEWFAYGAVSALHQTGVVDSLCFGSESGEIHWLQVLARRLSLEPLSFQQELKRQLKKGINYPAAYSAAVQVYIGDDALFKETDASKLAQPNNILGLHYLIALERLNSQIKPLTITRQKSEYHQKDITDELIASATAIRQILLQQESMTGISQYVPPYTYDILLRDYEAGRAPMHWDRFAAPLMHHLITSSPEQLAELHEVTEGLENRLKQILPKLDKEALFSMEQLTQALKTKRYTRTKLQRTLLRILLNHSKDELAASELSKGVPYLRILGFSDTGRKLLKRMKTTAGVPIISKPSKASHSFLELDIRAASAYALAYPRTSTEELFRDYYQSPIYLGGNASR